MPKFKTTTQTGPFTMDVSYFWGAIILHYTAKPRNVKEMKTAIAEWKSSH